MADIPAPSPILRTALTTLATPSAAAVTLPRQPPIAVLVAMAAALGAPFTAVESLYRVIWAAAEADGW